MSGNSQAEIFQNQKQTTDGKAWRFFKNYIRIDKEKYVFLLLFVWKMRDYWGFPGQQRETAS